MRRPWFFLFKGLYLFIPFERLEPVAYRINKRFCRWYGIDDGELPPWIPKWNNDKIKSFVHGPDAMRKWAEEHPVMDLLGYGWPKVE